MESVIGSAMESTCRLVTFTLKSFIAIAASIKSAKISYFACFKICLLNNLFKILPAAEDAAALHLLAEKDDAGIAFGFYSANPFEMKGLLWYQFEKDAGTLENIREVEKLLSSEDILQQSFLSVTLCSNVKEAILIPGKYYVANNAEALISLQFGEGNKADILTEEIPALPAVIAYRSFNSFNNIWSEKFPTSTFHHSTTLQLKENLFSHDVITCRVSPRFIKLFIYKNGILQLVQQFDYSLPADVVYHLLNVCLQYEMEPAEVSILLGGLIEENSALYQEIYKYFLHVKLDDTATGSYSELFQQYPSHYFSSLIHLARQCAL